MTAPINISLSSEAQTKELAGVIASVLTMGDVVLLNGGLAAGKTFFVRAAVAALGQYEGVSSPTYTLANLYQTPKAQVLHIDAYRLKSPAEFADLALEDELDSSITFIEWGESLKGEFGSSLSLGFTTLVEAASARSVEITGQGARGKALLDSISKALV